MSHVKWALVPMLATLPAAVICNAAQATVYLTEQQAQHEIFGTAKMTPSFTELTKEEAKEIKKRTGVNVRLKDVKMWSVDGGGKFFIDEVVGKHEFITYAIGVNKDGSVRKIEVMTYNETYGYEVREKWWRDQFIGKTSSSELKLDRDIKNIGGATLSCKHLADGVKRILATVDVLRSR